MITIIITAFIAFISTNIDDIFVLTLFFSQLNANMKKHHIVIGQYIGIAVLCSVSIAVAQGLSLIPHEYIRLLGIAPIYLGIKAYFDYRKANGEELNLDNRLASKNIEIDRIHNLSEIKVNGMVNYVRQLVNPSIIKVCSVTVANGGDNIGIYVPIFASMSLLKILLTLMIFAFLVGLWCFIAIKLSQINYVQAVAEKYKNSLVPIVFVGLGIFILLS
jgi:cadmium resistance transport/sequestration family protein